MSHSVRITRADKPFAPQMPRASHFINGSHVEPTGSVTFEVVDPARGRTLLSIRLGGAQDVNDAAVAARSALPTWSSKTPQERPELLLATADSGASGHARLGDAGAINCGQPR